MTDYTNPAKRPTFDIKLVPHTVWENDELGKPIKKVKWRADLFVMRVTGIDEDHHAIGETPSGALLELALYYKELQL
jgi:hypothetical protein